MDDMIVIVGSDNTEPLAQKEDKSLKLVEDPESALKRLGNVMRYQINNDCREDQFSKGREQLKYVMKDRKKELVKMKRMFGIIFAAVAHFKRKSTKNMLKLDKILKKLKDGNERQMLDYESKAVSLMSSYDDSNYVNDS